MLNHKPPLGGDNRLSRCGAYAANERISIRIGIGKVYKHDVVDGRKVVGQQGRLTRVVFHVASLCSQAQRHRDVAGLDIIR